MCVRAGWRAVQERGEPQPVPLLRLPRAERVCAAQGHARAAAGRDPHRPHECAGAASGCGRRPSTLHCPCVRHIIMHFPRFPCNWKDFVERPCIQWWRRAGRLTGDGLYRCSPAAEATAGGCALRCAAAEQGGVAAHGAQLAHCQVTHLDAHLTSQPALAAEQWLSASGEVDAP